MVEISQRIRFLRTKGFCEWCGAQYGLMYPETGQPVRKLDGRYGPYVNRKLTHTTVPKERDSRIVSLEQALEILAEREIRRKGRGKR